MGIFDRFKRNKPTTQVVYSNLGNPEPEIKTVEGNTLDPVIPEADPVIKEDRYPVRIYSAVRKFYKSGGNSKAKSLTVAEPHLLELAGNDYDATHYKQLGLSVNLDAPISTKDPDLKFRRKGTTASVVIHFNPEVIPEDTPYAFIKLEKRKNLMLRIFLCKTKEEAQEYGR